MSLDKIRTIFWARKVLEIDGLDELLKKGKHDQEKINKLIEERYKSVGSSFEHTYLYVTKLFSDKAIWKKYLSGDSVPNFSEEGKFFTNNNANQKHPYTVNMVEKLFPELSGFFRNGPYGLISVLECENTEDALEQYEISFSKFAKKSGYTKKTFDVHWRGPSIEDVECVDYTLTWDDIKKWLIDEPHKYFEILNRFLPDIDINQRWSKENEYSLFFHIISSYIEARFFKKIPHIYSNIEGVDAGSLARVTINDYQTGCESGILYLERIYGIDRKIWFENGLDSSNRNVFETARENAIELALSYSSERDIDIFPEYNEFKFDNI